MGTYEHDNERSSPIEGGGFIDQLSNCKFLKKDFEQF